MHILLLSQYFPPETGSAAAKISEMAEYLRLKNYQVSVVSQIPNYPSGVVYPGYQGAWFRREVLDGLHITRTWSYASPERDRFRPRFCNYASFMGTALAGIFSGPRPDLLLVYSPPLFLGVTATMVSKVWGCPFIFWVNDLWPRAALSLGFMQDNFAYRLACRLESFIYHQAARIFVYSQRMAAEVAKTGVDSAKIEYHPLWIDTDVFQPRPDAAKEIRRQYGWGERFVVLYGGNLGLAQGLDVLIETARLCRSLPDIHFVLVGSGVEKENLENLVKHYGLTNVEFIGHQPKDKVGTFFSAADLLFAHLKAAPHRVGTVPEKILAYMACGRPVLLGAQEGAAADLIQEHRCGLAVPPDDPQALAQAIESLLSHRQQIGQMGNQGRQAAEVHFSGPTVLKAMEASFLMLT